MAVIEFDRVSKRFGDGTVAVDDFNLRIEDGALPDGGPTGFAGSLGCGCAGCGADGVV